tara:strand:+ start:111028 stop:111504 length:477 start_codon:yes stop_codon:yes gene_type:complete
MAKKKCARCGERDGVLKAITFTVVNGEVVCQFCVAKAARADDAATAARVILTTTNSVDGSEVTQYLGIESAETVLGSGLLSEMKAGLSDAFGTRSGAFEAKLAKARESAMLRLKVKAGKLGGNAVIGVDVDYVEFAANMMGVVVTGTVVKIEPLAIEI